MPQAGPPTFTDPDLLAPGGIAIQALHITELRTAINDLRAQRGLSAYSWQTAVTGSIKADPILEMRTALDQALGPPPAPGYSAGLAQFQPILAIHIQELRNRVVAAWNAPVQIPVDGHANLSYDTATNRITTAGFAYDAAGNQVRALIPGSSNSQRYQYDAANRLVKVKTDDNQTVIATYTYGDSNERLILEEGGVRTYYACDGSAEYTETGSSTTPQWSKSYIYLGARLLSTLTPNGSGGHFVQYHHPDRLGTRLVTNAQDTNLFEQQTLPFGTALNESLPAGGTTNATNRRFTTYDRSLNTGLDYALNRHYDPQQGRFTQVDPIGIRAASLVSPQTLNMYSYCGNDPVNRTDPGGLFWGKLWRAIKKIVTSKWFQIALAVAIIVIAHYYPHSLFGFLSGSSSAGRAAPVLHAAATGPAAAAARTAAIASTNAAFAAGGVAALEGGIAASGIATAASLGLAGALGVSVAGKAQLTKQQRQEYDRTKSDAKKKLNSFECKDFLIRHGLQFQNVVNALDWQRPFNGLLSTITAVKAGLAKPGFLIANDPVQKLFSYISANAMAPLFSKAARFDVYLNLGLGYDGLTLVHEALHSATGLNDINLAFKLTGKLFGEQQGSEASRAISDSLRGNGCG